MAKIVMIMITSIEVNKKLTDFLVWVGQLLIYFCSMHMAEEEKKLEYSDRVDQNYETIRYNFEEDLIENWYSSINISEIDDWRDEFLAKEYEMYCCL